MSRNSSGAEWAGALLEDAIAAVLVNEMKAQRYTATEIQQRSGVKARSWANYYVNRSREIPTWAWVATGESLGLGPVDVIAHARELVASLTEAQAGMLVSVSGESRVLLLREIAKGATAGAPADELEDGLNSDSRRVLREQRERFGVPTDVADPSGRTRADVDDGSISRSA